MDWRVKSKGRHYQSPSSLSDRLASPAILNVLVTVLNRHADEVRKTRKISAKQKYKTG